MDENKYIDESWKDSVEKEKTSVPEAKGNKPQEAAHQHKEELPADDLSGAENESFEINFISYITSLAFQAMVFLGEIPNPGTEQIEKNVKQAKLIIDTLLLLKEKTVNNLKPQESETLTAYLYELQMKYVEIAGKE
ncbi:MAG TPA: DUF1844 domain-containing protein [Candidatus Omnitrophota bacterium]|nr:DUF1844 domain-containing protein [Candidatus Omnitrophota bacterium]HPD83921.1 DUF1844 domain-containing protein [Candidatus Omnitrophota bacterium]HRZ02778.1 DUF1844 domain-containing protein [Candidatus Omnitrophota bacterium]